MTSAPDGDQAQTHQPRAPVRDLAQRSGDKTEPEKSLTEGYASRAAGRGRVTSPTAAAAPSASTARSTSSDARTACRRPLRRSSTTPTAAPISPCSLPRRRQALHPRAGQDRGGRRCRRGRDADIAPGNCLPCGRFRRARPSTTSSWRPVAAASSAARPAPRSSWWLRRAPRRCACPPARCGWSRSSAAPRSGGSARRARARRPRQAGRAPPRKAPADPWRRDEPRRPPARGRGGTTRRVGTR